LASFGGGRLGNLEEVEKLILSDESGAVEGGGTTYIIGGSTMGVKLTKELSVRMAENTTFMLAR